jgi:hypothetical protein
MGRKNNRRETPQRAKPAVGDLVAGSTIDGQPVIGYVTRLHTPGALRVCTAPGHYVDVDDDTAVIA